MPRKKSDSTEAKSKTTKSAEAKSSFSFEIVQHIETLSSSSRGWNRELNIVSWNGGNPKFDLRDWSPEHDKMSKGITLTPEEINVLKSVLEDLDPFDPETY